MCIKVQGIPTDVLKISENPLFALPFAVLCNVNHDDNGSDDTAMSTSFPRRVA